MGFAICYASTRTVTPEEAQAIRAAAEAANHGRTWLSCEPVSFFDALQDGRIIGFSKPNFLPDPGDAESARREGLPDGRPQDVIDILAAISRDHGVDWELTHDFGTMGFIRGGKADPDLLEQLDGFRDLTELLGELGGDGSA